LGKGELKAGKGTARLSQRVGKMIKKLETRAAALATSAVPPENFVKLDLDNDGVITTTELAEALRVRACGPRASRVI
jgi:hypothetical protein